MGKYFLMAVLAMTVAALSLAGCDDGTPEDGAGGAGGAPAENPEEEGCEHMAEGPAAPVTASTDPATAGPAVSNDHKRYDVALGDVAGGKGGSVTFEVSEATDYLIFLSAGIPLAITDAAGAPVAIEATEQSSEICPGTIAVSHVVELGVGTYTFTFGPGTDDTVSLVLEEAGGEHHHE